MQIGDRVYVETPLFEGMATIDYIAPAQDGELYPIQVELDNPDINGHKLFRVSKHDIKKQQPKKHLQKYLARVIKPNRSFTVGEEYVISEPRADGYYSVYLTNRPDHAPVGSYLTNYFEIIRPFEVPLARAVVNDMPKKVTKKVEIVTESPKKEHNSSKKEQHEQLTLF